MKTQMLILTVVIVAVSFALPVRGWAQAVQTAQDHIALAQAYQEKANLAKQDLAGYLREKANNGRVFGIFSTNSETPRVKEKNRYYDDLIAQKKAEVIELNQLAEMYRFMARELERE